jgi:enoyl-CoA hydratase/carnithine racemase
MTSVQDHDDQVVADDDDNIRVLTLNRPEKLNAFTAAGYRAFREHLEEAAGAAAVAACIVTGRGRAFSTGVDLNELQKEDGAHQLDVEFDPLLESLARFPKPLIAAVNGDAVGFGATLLLHCDIVIVDETARIRMPFAPLGTAPEAGSSWLLPRRVGIQHAAWMMLTGEPLNAHAAVANGFALKTSSPGRALDDTLAIARQVSLHPVDVLVAHKQLLRAGWAAKISDAWRRERALMGGLSSRHGPIGR